MDQKIALVTGTSSGLGKAIAEHLLLDNYLVLGLSRREAPISHTCYQHFCVDITREKEVEKAFAHIDQEYGVDLLVNNAGSCEFSPLAETSSLEFQELLHTNVLGHFHILKHFEPYLVEGESHIITILSIAAKFAFENSSAYTASKFALKGLIETTQKEWSRYGVRFSNFYPGAILTPLWQNLDIENDKDNMLSIEDFLYVFKMCLNSPSSMSFEDITFMHKSGFIE